MRGFWRFSEDLLHAFVNDYSFIIDQLSRARAVVVIILVRAGTSPVPRVKGFGAVAGLPDIGRRGAVTIRQLKDKPGASAVVRRPGQGNDMVAAVAECR